MEDEYEGVEEALEPEEDAEEEDGASWEDEADGSASEDEAYSAEEEEAVAAAEEEEAVHWESAEEAERLGVTACWETVGIGTWEVTDSW